MSFLGFHRRDASGDDDGRPPQTQPCWEAALSGETEAFLDGRLVEHLMTAGRMVPAWAVLNQLAHASPSELASLAEIDGRPGNAREPGEPVWRAAQRSLASRLLASATLPDEITRIQQTVLVPLELRLIERSETETVTLRQAIRAASDALNGGDLSH
jgi:hypothetical protein